MAETGIDLLLLSVGADLPYVTGYSAMPLERLTMLVLPVDDAATLVVPRLEAPRVVEQPSVFSLRAWDETEDPIEIVAGLAATGAACGVGDRTWARFLIDLVQRRPDLKLSRADVVVGPIRAVKDDDEREALRSAAKAADRVIAQIQGGDVRLVGRTELEVQADVSNRLLAAGHQKVNFCIVGSGPNAASPHHDASGRAIEAGEVVLFDIGGTLDGYCSDITRCVHIGSPPAEFAELYDVLHDAQRTAVAAAQVGETCEGVDRAARQRIDTAGYGELFIHRTGHGIGIEEHEDPYIVEGNATPLEAGHAFSIEPGIYERGRWGARLEDIVVAAGDGPDQLNQVDHSLVVVEG